MRSSVDEVAEDRLVGRGECLTRSPMLRRIGKRLKSVVYGVTPSSRLIQRGPSSRRRVALTFDDGPGELTRAYLDVLDAHEVRATFFVLGRACEREPALLDEYERRGHQVAGHGWDHVRFPRLSWRALDAQLDRTDAAIGHRSAARPWVRPPHGDVDPRVFFQLLAKGWVIALWSLDPRDYEVHDPLAIAERCSPSRVAPGEVILLHEGRPGTLEALPRVITALRDAGYAMGTMAEMLAP